jgi:hypothetical protein
MHSTYRFSISVEDELCFALLDAEELVSPRMDFIPDYTSWGCSTGVNITTGILRPVWAW